MIIVAVFAHSPAIEHLVHHQKAHAIAQIQKLRCRRIVRGADGIYAERFQGREPFLPDAQRHGHAQSAGILMQTDALEFEIIFVQPKAGVRVEMKFANAKGNLGFIIPGPRRLRMIGGGLG